MSHNSDPFIGFQTPPSHTITETSSVPALASYSMPDNNLVPSPAFPVPHTPSPLPQRSLSQFHGLGNGGSVAIPHVLCVAEATEDLLLRSGNIPFTVTKQQVNALSREVDALRVENQTYRTNYEKLVATLPQLLGMQPGSSNAKLGMTSTSSSPTAPQPTILGWDWSYPTPPAKPSGVNFQFWFARDYKERPKKGHGRQGPHDENINIAQQFIEDEEGHTVSGTVAKDIRDMLRTLFHSLVWSGQAALSQDHLTHEARVYIHVMLSRRFPCLLLCDGGTWKINALIKQAYHGFAGLHVKAIPHSDSAKLESPASDTRDVSSPSLDLTSVSAMAQRKRDRQGSLAADPEDSQPPKVLRLSPAAAMHGDNLHSQAPSPVVAGDGADGDGAASDGLAARAHLTNQGGGDHHKANDRPSHESSDGSQTGRAASTDADMPNASMVHVDDGVVDKVRRDILISDRLALIGNNTMSSGSTTQYSTDNAQDASPGHARVSEPNPLPEQSMTLPVPVKNPFASMSSHQRSTRLPSSFSTNSTLPAPVMTANKVGAQPRSSQDASARPGLSPLPQTDDTAPTVPDGPDGDITTPSIAAGPSKKRGGKVASVKAQSKYKPEVISVQNFLIRGMLLENPDVLYADCLAAYKNLSAAQRDLLKNECALERKQKRPPHGAGVLETTAPE